MKNKNVIIFYTDQLRADYLGCYGNEFAITPNIDALAAQGTRYNKHYASSPVCMPSRGCFYTGRTILANRVLDNGVNLPADEVTLAETFRRAGYATHNYGKLHHEVHLPFDDKHSYEALAPYEDGGELADWYGPYCGFEHAELAIGHGEDAWGHYGIWRKANFPDLKIGPETALGDTKYPNLQIWESGVPVEAHASTWVADRTIDFLKNREDKPFFLNVSFPDPHHSFTPPKAYADKFAGIEFPEPHQREGEHEDKPQPYKDGMAKDSMPYRESDPDRKDDLPGYPTHKPALTGDAYNRMIAHTHAMMNLVDDCVGRVMDEVRAQGLEKDTVIVFTSDHGDFLGDHGLFLKGLLPCRSLLHIPLIIADPEQDQRICEDTCSNIDVMPSLLNMCGLEIPNRVQGEVLPGPGETMQRKYAFEAVISKGSSDLNHFAIFQDQWKIAYFPQLDDGELYDLEKDPHELVNLYHKEEYTEARDKLLIDLFKAVGRAEPAHAENLAGRF